MNPTIRAFIAVEIAQGSLAKIAKTLRPIKRAFPSIKWVEQENFHVTLKFLGSNVPVTQLHRVMQAVERACKSVEQFDVALEGFGAFPDANNPKTLWVGITEGTEELELLAQRIDEELSALGFPHENRAFSPHLTIGRARRNERGEGRDATQTLTELLQQAEDADFGVSPIDSVVLYSSELMRGGPKYEALATFDLAPLGADLVPQECDEETQNDPQPQSADVATPKPMRHAFDVQALDLDIDEELREILGDMPGRSKNRKSR